MDFFSNRCCGSATATEGAAQRRLDDLASSPWHTDCQVTVDVNCVRHRIDIMRATNDLDLAELLNITHSCTVCKSEATDESYSTTLAKALVDNAKDKLERVEAVAARIKNRGELIERLERHLVAYNKICGSLNIIVNNGEIDYSYKIDPKHGVCLVIRLRDMKKGQSGGTSFIDLEDPTPILTPALSPVRRPITVSSTLVLPTRNITESYETEVVETKKEAKITPSKLNPESRPSFLQDRRSEVERPAALHAHAGNPLSFYYGIQYKPRRPSSPALGQLQKAGQSRMVVFSNLDPGTTYTDLLNKVRGGPVLRAVRADPTTAFVYFVRGEDAYAYVKHVNDGSLGRTQLKVKGKTPRVTLAPTPSYPIRCPLMQRIEQDGVTRCLAFPQYDAAFGRLLEAFLTRWKFRDYTVTQQPRAVVDDDDVEDNAQGRSSNAPSELAEEWVVEDDELAAAAKKPKKSNMDLVHFDFRDVVHAQDAYQLICNGFPHCEVDYGPDPCAGSLDELEGY
ncbi:hypothetical protein GQX73_g10568 [Xylaria multiplex]|uniref:Uncharacterized protein n=1 Tax=Xylaria multiplex TaxID=323545 RepID=A0A7C8IL12_9PEZI|nr:hypothetical protein GQX73_g10568 [Xylaria multiplex]